MFREQLDKESKEKAELVEARDDWKKKYETEVTNLEVKEAKFKEFKEEALKLANEEKIVFDTMIDASQKEVVEMKTIIDSLTKDLVELRKTAGEESFSKDHLEKLKQDHEEVVKSLKEEIVSAKERGEKQENEKNIINEESKKIHANSQVLVKENEDLKKKNEELVKEVEKLKEYSVKDRKMIESSTDDLKEALETLESMEQDKEKTEEECSQVKAELKKKTVEIEKLKTMYKDSVDLLDDVKLERNTTMKEKLQEMSVQNSKMESLLLKCQKELKESRSSYECLVKHSNIAIKEQETKLEKSEERLKEVMRAKISADLELVKMKEDREQEIQREAEERVKEAFDIVMDEEKTGKHKDNLFEQFLDEAYEYKMKKEQEQRRSSMTAYCKDSKQQVVGVESLGQYIITIKDGDLSVDGPGTDI